MRAKLAPIYSNRHLKHEGMPFFPLASHFTTFLLGHAQKSEVAYVLRLLIFFLSPFLFSFSYLLAA